MCAMGNQSALGSRNPIPQTSKITPPQRPRKAICDTQTGNCFLCPIDSLACRCARGFLKVNSDVISLPVSTNVRCSFSHVIFVSKQIHLCARGMHASFTLTK